MSEYPEIMDLLLKGAKIDVDEGRIQVYGSERKWGNSRDRTIGLNQKTFFGLMSSGLIGITGRQSSSEWVLAKSAVKKAK